MIKRNICGVHRKKALRQTKFTILKPHDSFRHMQHDVAVGTQFVMPIADQRTTLNDRSMSVRRIYHKLCLGLFVLALAACSSAQSRADKAAMRAVTYFNAGNYDQARVEILSAVAERDDVASQWQLLGRTELALSHLPEAYTAYSRVLELEAANTEALRAVGELAFQTGRPTEAVRVADRSLSLQPGAAWALLIKGLVALDARRLPDAIGFAETILKSSPQDEFANLLKARALALQKDYRGALNLVEANVPAPMRTEASYSTLVEIYRRTGEIVPLVENYEKLIAKLSSDTGMKLDFAGILYKAGRIDQARAILYALVIKNPKNADLMFKVSELWTEYDPQPISDTQLASLQKTGSVSARVGISRYWLNRGAAEKAAAMLTPVIGKSGDSRSDAGALYATALYALGDTAKASAIAAEVLDVDKNDADALLLRARIAIQNRQADKALNDLQIVVRDHPGNEQGRIALASYFAGKKDLWRARQIYEESLDFLPQSLSISASFADFLYASGDPARAESVLREFTLRNPSSVKGWAAMASACRSHRNISCASNGLAGMQKAANVYTLDERPGTLRTGGLFGRL
jgi:tetratricopeptide (TPR) repeat protein